MSISCNNNYRSSFQIAPFQSTSAWPSRRLNEITEKFFDSFFAVVWFCSIISHFEIAVWFNHSRQPWFFLHTSHWTAARLNEPLATFFMILMRTCESDGETIDVCLVRLRQKDINSLMDGLFLANLALHAHRTVILFKTKEGSEYAHCVLSSSLALFTGR